MPARSKIAKLPEDLRKQLDAKLITNGFSDCRGLSAWLAEQGYSISKDAVARHTQGLERKLEAVKRATEQAKAIVEASPDDEGAMNDALIRLVQQIDFDILVQLDEMGVDEVNPKSLAAITRSVASLARATVSQKKWMLEAREKLAAKVKSVDDQLAVAKKAGGLSADAESAIRKALLDVHV
jgi:hypothetical protein